MWQCMFSMPVMCTVWRRGLQQSSKAVYKRVWHIALLSVQWINSWWWTDELSETCRFSWQNKFVKLVHLVGFITKKFVTRQHGHMNVKKNYDTLRWSNKLGTVLYLLSHRGGAVTPRLHTDESLGSIVGLKAGCSELGLECTLLRSSFR